jgi:hypothetical protein
MPTDVNSSAVTELLCKAKPLVRKYRMIITIRAGRFAVRIPVKARYLPHHQNAHTESGVHTASYSVDTVVPSCE